MKWSAQGNLVRFFFNAQLTHSSKKKMFYDHEISCDINTNSMNREQNRWKRKSNVKIEL